MSSKRGYSLVSTVDPDSFASSSNYGAAANSSSHDINKPVSKKKAKTIPRPLRPGLFVQFGNRGKFSTALAKHSESENEGESIELVSIKPRRSKLKRGKLKSPKSGGCDRTRTLVIEEPILPGDTVQRVALRYGCRDTEIRRVNNLYSDQDFFALKTVKIAVKEHGLLTEQAAREKCRTNRVEERNADSSTSDERRLGGASAYYVSDDEPICSSGDADDEVGDSDSPEYRDISLQSAIKWKHTNQTLLQKLDADLEKVREDNEKRFSNTKEIRVTLDTPAFQAIMAKKQSYESRLLLFNLDWKILLVGIIALMVVVAFVTGGFIYYKFYKLPDPSVHDKIVT